MQSVQTGLWDPHPPYKHASPLPAPPTSSSRHAHVTTAAPAKRITFYKSGDSQFGGVRMAIHKRSFKCFDALLDDLSQKVPLPFGVRTVTTPRGTHTIKHLEQLQDGGCYLCSDRRQAKPINMDLASKRQGIWYHHSRRPQRPEVSSGTPPGHLNLPHRQRRILLVKNSEPGMRRSIVLSRRSTRSLRAFLDEVSEVMQFHVRKLYTAEGRRIDSVQSLLTCPGVLVCVGREAFSPMLINFIRKTSEEKLPGLGAQSRASEYDEGNESKKNVNFGLETKKSIIHPRSDSSNRSARFSLSSEKSYGVFSQARPAITNDDIEKRVLVNKDGSLSVEMRVRFRLQNEETVQWSTQIKKSPSLTNDCCPLSQAQPHYLQQGTSESCSDPDSTSYEGVDYSSRPLERALLENQCQCCYQRHERQFDLWENPTHKHPPAPPVHSSSHAVMRHTHSSSSSSSFNSRRLIRCRARVSGSPGGSGSGQSQLVQKEMCLTEQVEKRVEVAQDGDTQVEVCKVSRCCSRTEVVAIDTNIRPPSGKSVEGEVMMGEDEIRPLSTVSSSSHILQSLKEDQDDEEDDLPPSASQCSHRNEASPTPTPVNQLDEGPSSIISVCSVQSLKRQEQEENAGSRALSSALSCHCGATNPHSTAKPDQTDRVPSLMSQEPKNQASEEEAAAAVDNEEINRGLSGLSHDTGLSAGSQKSSTSNNTAERTTSSMSNKSGASVKSHKSGCLSVAKELSTSNKTVAEEGDADKRAQSSLSMKSNASNKSEKREESGVEDRSASALSATSKLSAKSNKSHRSTEALEKSTSPRSETGEDAEEIATSQMSGRLSVHSTKSCKCNDNRKAPSPALEVENNAEEIQPRPESIIEDHLENRSTSPRSCKSDSSAKSHNAVENRYPSASSQRSHTSAKSTQSKRSNQPKESQNDPNLTLTETNREETDIEQREALESVMSAKSKSSVKSDISSKNPSATNAVKINSEGAQSCSSKRQRKESGCTDQPLSRNGSGSISLGLQEDQETAESDCGKSMVDIPTIETPREGEKCDEEGGEQPTERPANATTVQSSRSHKSCCNCSVKSAAQSKGKSSSPIPTSIDKAESVKSAATTNARKMDTPKSRSSSAMSGTQVCGKSPSDTTSNVNTSTDAENQKTSRPGIKSGDHKSHKGSECGSTKVSSSRQKETPPKSTSPCSLHSPGPASKVKPGSGSTLSHSLSAADLLKETLAAARQQDCQSKASKTSEKAHSEKSRRSQRSRSRKDWEDVMEMTPECLPNASPNEVVSDWLRSIPANTSMLTLDNELNDEETEEGAKEMEETPTEEVGTGEMSPEDEKVELEEKREPQVEEKKDEAEGDGVGPTLGDTAEISSRSRNWHSSAAVMKVLLSSSLGRCRSMPEVSPVYGRRLSTSARRLLDCLAQLQLIEPAVSSHEQKDRKQQYDEIMAILQSLWLTEPHNINVKDTKDGGTDQVTPPRSSSGVGMSSGSGGSGGGKSNGNQGEDEPPRKETESLQEEEAAEKVVEEDNGNAAAEQVEAETEVEETNQTDTAEEVMKSEEQSTLPPDSSKATDNPSLSEKSSPNDSSKSERDTQEDSSSGTPPSAPRPPLSKRLSQDPDPVWVLHLLKKLEKQFMNHYIEAMEEFKVRWDLDDSLILDTMISELREEVSRRIQSSIEREMRKIQSRAGKVGRSPRPPQLANMSRDSTMTEKRRRMLKVMKNQSVKTAESLTDEEMVADFSDQRSDDEYCPCEACVRKKMAARPFKKNPLAAEAPVMMEFDLLKILQLKKSPLPPSSVPKPVEEERAAADEEGRSLEVVEEEEEEETKEDIKADVVLEETIPEEDNSAEDEELETDEQQETSENAEEDDGLCTCQSESNKEEEGEAGETSNYTDEGEAGTGEEEEEESDRETVKEATTGNKEAESEDDTSATNGEPTLAEEMMRGNVGTSASEEERNSPQTKIRLRKLSVCSKLKSNLVQNPQSQVAIPAACVTEGEEADAEDSDDSKRHGDASADESAPEEAASSGEEEAKSSREDEQEDAVEEFRLEQESEAAKGKNEDGTLLHQFTRTSVESQPGSMEDVDMDLPSNSKVVDINGHKTKE
uniref:Rp1 like 1a n=1 Tax=Poecilia formosa TaxID=48698 RepID=A0A087YCJ5_POEFO